MACAMKARLVYWFFIWLLSSLDFCFRCCIRGEHPILALWQPDVRAATLEFGLPVASSFA